MVSQPAVAKFKKGLLKSRAIAAAAAADESIASKTFEVKATDIRTSSPIPEDPVGEEVGDRQSKSTATSGSQEKAAEDKQRDKDGTHSGDQVKTETAGTAKGDAVEKAGTSEEKTEEGRPETSERKTEAPEAVPIQTTKLRGKSKATGQIMGGWI